MFEIQRQMMQVHTRIVDGKTFALLSSIHACGKTLFSSLSETFPVAFFMYRIFISFTNSFFVAFRFIKTFVFHFLVSSFLLYARFRCFYSEALILFHYTKLVAYKLFQITQQSAFNFIFSSFRFFLNKTQNICNQTKWNVNRTETRKWAKVCSREKNAVKIPAFWMCWWRKSEREIEKSCINILCKNVAKRFCVYVKLDKYCG